MKKLMYLLLLLTTVLVCATLFVACKGSEETTKTYDTITVETADGTILCTVKNGAAGDDAIRFEVNGRNVYSWYTVVNNERVRVIYDEKLETAEGDVLRVCTLNTDRVVVYPDKYYTLLRIDGTIVTQKAVYGEIPRPLPVSQKGYSEFLDYYYRGANNEKITVTGKNGEFLDIWNVVAKELTVYSEYDAKAIRVCLDYGVENVTHADESGVPDYLYYGDAFDFDFPMPSSLEYEFVGWYTEATAGVTIVDDKGMYKDCTEFKADAAKHIRFDIPISDPRHTGRSPSARRSPHLRSRKRPFGRAFLNIQHSSAAASTLHQSPPVPHRCSPHFSVLSACCVWPRC